MLLCDTQLRILAFNNGMIQPFADRQVRTKGDGTPIISYGLSSFGYDIRCGRDFKIFTDINTALVDPKNITNDGFVDFFNVDSCIIPPNSFALCSSIEYMRMPGDVLAICMGKSTYARCGIIVNVTPLEPGWEGQITLEISNTTPLPVKIYADEGIAQLLFFQGDEIPLVAYNHRDGKYQHQTGITLPKV